MSDKLDRRFGNRWVGRFDDAKPAMSRPFLNRPILVLGFLLIALVLT